MGGKQCRGSIVPNGRLHHKPDTGIDMEYVVNDDDSWVGHLCQRFSPIVRWLSGKLLFLEVKPCTYILNRVTGQLSAQTHHKASCQ